MRLLQRLIQTPFAGAVGWTLLHSLWEGCIVAAALAAILWALRSARARYAAACLAMLVLLAAFGFTLVRLMPDPPLAPALQSLAVPAGNVPADRDTPGPPDTTLSMLVPWLAPFWMAGILAFYMRHLAGFAVLHRLRRQGVCSAPERWQKEIVRLSAQMRLSRPILLFESCLAEVPVVLGFFRPVILMPVEVLARLPAGQIEAILLHELAHVRRQDYLVNVLQRLVEGLLFYHPAVWWMSRIVRAERENCCDDVVVSIRGNAHEYAIALAALEQDRGSGREPALAATGGSLVTRVRRLLYPAGSKPAWTPVLAAVILTAGLAVGMGAWQAVSPAGSVPAEQWLNQDVVYIIADAERADFRKLRSDEQRGEFIKQFWERRNPSPGSSENAFKKEHYRRIAYADGHWQTFSGTPGWQTDRGHMYILYGPPDEIESHPAAAANPFGFEVWLYRHVEGIGDRVTLTFVDRTGRGDFKLAPGNGR